MRNLILTILIIGVFRALRNKKPKLVQGNELKRLEVENLVRKVLPQEQESVHNLTNEQVSIVYDYIMDKPLSMDNVKKAISIIQKHNCNEK